MVIVNFPEKLVSFEARKKFGIPNQYGHIIYGVSKYGVKNDFAGIYRMCPRASGRLNVRERFYAPSDQTQPNKVARQIVFAAAVLAWQALDASQKEFYRLKSKNKHMSGYNVFLHEYLISH